MNRNAVAAVAICAALLAASAAILTSAAWRAGAIGAAMTREEFRASVIGKTPDEVVAAVGRPDRTSEGAALTIWTYEGRTADPATGRRDGEAWADFDRRTGRCVAARFR